MTRRQKVFPDPEGSISFTVDAMCRSEIEAAIDALVINENLVAAHVLASAAHDVMRGHAKRIGADLRADMLSILKPLVPGREKAFIDTMLKPYNAMKHSNASDVAVTVHPSLTEAILFCATQEFGSLFKYLSGKMVLFVAWYTAVEPSLRDRAGNKPEFLLEAFPSAAKAGSREEKRADLRALLLQHMIDPSPLRDYRDTHSTDGLWNT
ncbi:hypothetical protein [Sphingomonas sp. GM_Shp_2]|uniref:hypothetical protein n=1 Tax=Sphingomonas sp. GM_Shp_2 TaxID=2937380 RepID=UPI00226A9D64|nr:hypothetical protein [Sphingomonas sp. GM_Shp_2]